MSGYGQNCYNLFTDTCNVIVWPNIYSGTKVFLSSLLYVLLFTTFCYCLYIIIIIITIIASSYIVHIAKNAHNKYKKLIIIN